MIICGFPAIGKTTFSNQRLDTLDLDSSQFNWIVDGNAERVRNPHFPKNYIDAVIQNLGKFKYILISTHYLVRDELNKRNIPYLTVVPSLDCYWEYQERMKKRGDTEKMIYLVSYCWYDWITERYKEKNLQILELGETLQQAVDRVEESDGFEHLFVEKSDYFL
jgi:hypothetical protein